MLSIHDFASDDDLSFLGTRWRCFTDRVMGGLSDAECALSESGGERCLRLSGRVSLANNGGFIQAALSLAPSGAPFSAADYAGLRLRVRTDAPRDAYSIHLRTRDCRLPWQYYVAPLPVGEGWREIEVPFAAFRPVALDAPLDRTALTRVGLVAAKEAFAADLALARIAFYR